MSDGVSGEKTGGTSLSLPADLVAQDLILRSRSALLRRKRRHASHEALYYLGLVKPTRWERIAAALDKERRFTVTRLYSAVDTIRLGSESYGLPAAVCEDRRTTRADTAWALVRAAVVDAVNGGGGLDDQQWSRARSAFANYLVVSRPRDPSAWARHSLVPTAIHLGTRNALGLVGLAGAGQVLKYVDQVGAVAGAVSPLFAVVMVTFVFAVALSLRFGWTKLLLPRTRFASSASAHAPAAESGDETPSEHTAEDVGSPGDLPWYRQAILGVQHARVPSRGEPRTSGDPDIPFWLAARILARRIPWYVALYAGWFIAREQEFGASAYLTAVFLLVPFLVGELLDRLDHIGGHAVRVQALVALAGCGAALYYANLAATSLPVGLLIGFNLFLLWRWDRAGAPRRIRLTLVLAWLGVFVGLVKFSMDRDDEQWVHDETSPAVERVQPGAWPAEGGGPVVVIAASGGGSRAAIYTALTLEALHRLNPELACSVQAISSVSGGSLANAVYTAHRAGAFGVSPCAPGSARELGWLVREVDGDFVRPTIGGILNLFRSRAELIEEAFGKHTSSLSIEEIADRWRSEETVRPPLPMFNTATSSGHVVVISPLARSTFEDPAWKHAHSDANLYDAHDDADPPTWVYYRSAVTALEDFAPNTDVRLSQAVRASANFPFAFPPIEVVTERPFSVSADPRERHPDSGASGSQDYRLKLTDGGVVSNSGVWPLYHLLKNQAARLQERGVILLIVEASRMPEFSRSRSVLGGVTDQGAIGRQMHRQMLAELERAYRGRLAVVQVQLPSSERFNVMTSWVLTLGDIGKLLAGFALEWPEAARGLTQAWNVLKRRDGRVEPTWRARPPLD